MKNNTLFKIENQPGSVLLNSKGSACVMALMIGLLASQDIKAQFVNSGGIKVNDKTIMAVDMNYINTASGSFINNGNVHVFQNWKNDGTVSFSDPSDGSTLFRGTQQQLIEGEKISNLQNVVFNNSAGGKTRNPFDLKTVIEVGKNADFIKGIINADAFGGLVIFNEKAKHTNAGNQSFVDGQVQKDYDKNAGKGDNIFQFPVGAVVAEKEDSYFRPSYYNLESSLENSYRTQYFYKNSGDLYSHESKDPSIITINNQEYWEVTQIDGTDKIVLSLTLDKRTTPDVFFDNDPNTQLAIVRWDPRAGIWVNEGGVLSEDISGEAYSNLLTSQVEQPVSGYGIFTMAIVTKTPPTDFDVIVYNAISPNDDGHNDAFLIEGIKNYPDNNVEIYNRWGVKVYDATSYNESDNMFRGYSDGRGTVKRGDKLPTGTYFYILRYKKGDKGVEKSGYLYINNQ